MIKSWIPSFDIPSKETRYGDTQVFIDTENNICFIIDGACGTGTNKLISYLKNKGIKKVYLVISHAHYDHTYGIQKIIDDNYFTVIRLYCYDPKTLQGGLRNNAGSKEVRSDIASLNNIISKANSKKIPVTFLKHGDKVSVGDIKFNVYREQPSVVADDDTEGWSYMNDGSLCFYFPNQYYWTSGDGPDSIWNLINKLGLIVKFFKIPHHGNNCPKSQANGLKSHGANLCWYNDLEPNGIGTNEFTAYGARRCKEAGIMVLNCIGPDIEMTFADKKAIITKGTSKWTYSIPYSAASQEGWVKDKVGWWYRFADGSWAKGWQYLKWSKGVSWFYFNDKGYVVYGWQQLKWSKGTDWFYFDKETGAMVTGWQELEWSKGKDWFYFDRANGNMKTGWQLGPKEDLPGWFFLDKTTGAMRKGWIFDNKSWYWLNRGTGEMATGWLEENGKTYYLEPRPNYNQGHAYQNTTATIDGEIWDFDNNCYGTKRKISTPLTTLPIGQKVIDISQFNNVSDWTKVKATGYPVIIRIGYRGSKTGIITYDPKYKEYRAACEKNGIPHSFYFFPCSITKAEAEEEAQFIINEVKNTNISLPVYLDSEVVQRDKSGRSDTLSKEKRTEMLEIICNKLLVAGVPCGVYASRSWLYNNLDMSKIAPPAEHNTWVAEYGVSKNKYYGNQVLWQYTSDGSVNGIDGRVDLSTVMDAFNMASLEKQEPEKQETKPIEKSEWEKVLEVAKAELGYLQKKSNSNLDSKTGNAGANNYTKYWRDINDWCGKNYQAQPWCAGFVTWCITKALGMNRAKELLKHYPYVYCPTLGSLFTKYANPQVGDIVIFYKNGTFAHTGFVIAVNGDKFTTIEGNTSGASSIVDNGGGVCQKTYYNSKLPGTKFCRPAYNSTSISSDVNKVVVADDIHTVKWKGIVKTDGSNLAVRLQPKLSAKECSFSPLKNGTEVGVSHEQGEWYLIKYNGKFGYVYADYIVKK